MIGINNVAQDLQIHDWNLPRFGNQETTETPKYSGLLLRQYSESEKHQQNQIVDKNQFNSQQSSLTKPTFLVDANCFINFRSFQKKRVIQRRLRKNMMLPNILKSSTFETNLSNKSPKKQITLKPQINTLPQKIEKYSDRNRPKYKTLSNIMELQKSSSVSLKRKQSPISMHFRTQPSSLIFNKSHSEQKSLKQLNGPKIIYLQILKHATNLNIARNKVVVQNKARKDKQLQETIQINALQHQSKKDDKCVELLTFYPRQMCQQSDDQNQFLSDGYPSIGCNKEDCNPYIYNGESY